MVFKMSVWSTVLSTSANPRPSALFTPTSISDEVHNEEAALQAVARLQSLGGQKEKDEAAKIQG